MSVDAKIGGGSLDAMSGAPPFVLRTVTAKDDRLLLRLYGSTRADELASAGWTRKRQDDFLRDQHAARESDYRVRFPDARRHIVVANGEDVGAIMVDRHAAEIRLVDIALLPAHRGKGIGTALLLELQREARRANKPLRLQVLRSNPACHLYLRLGFSPVRGNGLYLEMEWPAIPTQ